MNNKDTQISIQHELKQRTIIGQHGTEREEEVQLLEQIGESSDGISDCKRKKTTLPEEFTKTETLLVVDVDLIILDL